MRADVAAAFVDRTPIDWTSLLRRTRNPRDRAIVDELRALDSLRDALRPSAARAARAHGRFVLLHALAAISAVQIIIGLAVAAAAIAAGQPMNQMEPRVLLAAAFAIAALLLGIALPRDERTLFLLATFVFTAAAFARGLALAFPSLSPTWAAILFHGLFPESFAPAALWSFAVVFPHVRRFTWFDIVARRTAAAAWAFGAVLFTVNLTGAYGAVDRTMTTMLDRNHDGNLFWHLFVLVSFPAVAALFVRSHRATPIERRKVRRLACAVSAGAAPFLLVGLARLSSPGFNQWVVTASPDHRFWLDAPIVAALALLPIFATMAIVLDRPFGIAFTLPNVHRVLYRRSLPRDHRALLANALERVRTARTPRELATIVRKEMQMGTGAAKAQIIDGSSIPCDGALAAMLQDSTAALDLSPESALFALMPRQDREWLDAHGVTLAAPIKLRDGTIAAAVALSAKPGGAAFDRRDRWFVSALLMATAAAWDTAARSTELPQNAALECPRCGVVFESEPVPCECGEPPAIAAVPVRLGEKFIARRRLGAGGMGVVYLADDCVLGREVALKTLPELRDGTVPRLYDEARAMAALNHESLATIYGLEVWKRTPVLVVEYFPNGTLASRLAQGYLPVSEVIDMGVRLADALIYMHERGVLHRDIKPSNIGLTAAGTPKLLDFGVAAAPFGVQASVSVDLCGLSRALLNACGGRERLPRTLVPFFDRALSHLPERGFRSSEELRNALQALRRVLCRDSPFSKPE